MGNVQTTPGGPQAIALPNTQKPGYSAIYRNSVVGEGPLVATFDPEVTTLYENFQKARKQFSTRPCLGIRKFADEGGNGEYYWQTYETIGKRIHNLASGLVHLGVKRNDRVGIFAKNRPEWVIAEMACYEQAFTGVALYDTLGADATAYIINHAEISVIICTQDKIKRLIENAEQYPGLKMLVQIEYEGNRDLIGEAEKKGITLISFAEVEDKGAFKQVDPNPSKADDMATIMYTSGTTGVPKGVILTHKNILSAVSGTRRLVGMRDTDVHISFLPLAHIFERLVHGGMFSAGGAIGFFQGDVLKLFDDIYVLKPTILPGVPRLFSRVYDKVMQGKDSKGGVAKFLFDLGYSSKQSVLEEGSNPSESFWNSIVFDKIREKFGGRVRVIATGAAPMSKELFQFLQICFSCPVMQGYGLTETSAASTVSLPNNLKGGHAGPPTDCCEIRLADVPDMKYLASDKPCPRGEVCIRGLSVFSGYYKQPDATKEAFDDDGFFHTGDIGQINEDGTLSIIDRKKNIFKLSQGEYVAAEYLEGVFQKSRYALQVFVYGDSTQAYLVGIVVPDPDTIIPWAKENGIGDKMDVICNNPKTKKFIHDDINQNGKSSKLQGYEFLKAIHLEPVAFSVENELLTPTFKYKRPQLKDHYKTIIDQLYASLNEKK